LPSEYQFEAHKIMIRASKVTQNLAKVQRPHELITQYQSDEAGGKMWICGCADFK